MEKKQWKHKVFHTLAPALVPIFAEETSITFKARVQPFSRKQQTFSAKRHQIPISTAFAITAHKAQGRTFSKAVLDLEKPKPPPSMSEHQTFCSTNVMLSRLQSFSGLHLLTPISLSSIRSKPDSELREQQNRLMSINEMTIRKWKAEVS